MCNYNSDIFDAATVRDWLEDYRTLLATAADDSARPISKLLPADAEAEDQVAEPIPEEERKRVTVLWNQTQRPFPEHKGVHQIFEEQVERTPGVVAIVANGTHLSYSELNRRANQLARVLMARGVTRGACVGICMERSEKLIVGMLAVLKTGGAYVPLDPSYPAERLALMIRETGARTILAEQKFVAMFAQSDAEIVDCDDSCADREPALNLDLQVAGDDLAYVMFTSGSTGKPKGAAILHRGISRLVINTDYVQISPSDAVAQVSNSAFDAATFEIWAALLNGARVVVIPKETLLSAPALKKHCIEHGVTTMFLTTALFNQLARAGGGVFTPIKHLLFGGEAADPRVVSKILKNGRPERLVHVYGPTEATTFATWHELTDAASESVPIGRPIANTTIFLLDKMGAPVPVGTEGEIFLGGPGLARGYLGAPELTEERFVETPFGRLYRTGDLGRWMPEGTVEFLGRADQQVKLRGFRIEPGEIEQALRKHPAVTSAVVTVMGEGDARRLVAHVVASGTASADLERFLADRLPPHLVPSAIVLLDKMPLNANGKIDRTALPEPMMERAPVPPRDALEVQLVSIWEETLGRKSIGVRDDFFELGGHSLLAVRIFTEIERALGKNLPLATLFCAPTIEKLANEIRAGESPERWSSIVPIRPQGSKPPLFCVHGGDGGVLVYTDLASALPSDQPFYGLQAQGLDGQPIRHTTIPAMAAFYIEEMRKVQPRGPYFIGGFSFGGVAAFEMAQQLRAQGEEVGLCALFDTINPASPGRRYTLVERISLRTRAMLELPLRQQARYFFGRAAGKLMANLGKERERLHKLTSRIRKASDGTVPTEYRNLHVREAHLKAFMEYSPKFFAGEMTLFRADNPNDGYEWTEQLGWEGLVAELEIRRVPGEHETIFQRPNVEALARELSACLEAAASPVHVIG